MILVYVRKNRKQAVQLKEVKVAQSVKNLPAKQETQEMQFWSLGLEDSREEELATHSSILAWKIP